MTNENDAVKVRKPRTKKTLAERLMEQRKREENLAYDFAKQALQSVASLQGIVDARANLMRYARECDTFNSPEKIQEIRERLMARLASLDARAAIAAEYLPRVKATLDKVDSLFVNIGTKIQNAVSNGADPSNVDVAGIVSETLSPADRETLQNPADPFGAFRRKRSAEDSAETMPDVDEDSAGE